VILVEINMVAVQWVRHETPPVITSKSKIVGRITFIPTFVYHPAAHTFRYSKRHAIIAACWL
jgi:hypothetical protein